MVQRFVLVAAFAAMPGLAHAAGTATVRFEGREYTLQVISCEGGPDSFGIQARADSDTTVIQLGAFKGSVDSVGFRVGDTMAQVADQTGSFDGTTFRFDGEAQVYSTDAINRKKLSVTATCANG